MRARHAPGRHGISCDEPRRACRVTVACLSRACSAFRAPIRGRGGAPHAGPEHLTFKISGARRWERAISAFDDVVEIEQPNRPGRPRSAFVGVCRWDFGGVRILDYYLYEMGLCGRTAVRIREESRKRGFYVVYVFKSFQVK